MRILLLAVLAAALAAQQSAKRNPAPEAGDDKRGYTDTPQIPGQTWKVHDAARPRPPRMTPGLPLPSAPPPADAVQLFNGKDLSQWVNVMRGGTAQEPKWRVENGYMEIVPHTGRLVTKEKFGDCQLHVEWMVPVGSEGAGQGRGNSGIELMGRYEIQILESFENVTYADGQAASIYGQWPPRVNVSRPQGEWNAFDIFFEAPVFERGKLEGETPAKPAFVTVLHNGVMVHHRQEILGAAVHRRVAGYKAHGPEEPLSLQDHGRPVRFRNVWIRRLKAYDTR